MILIEILIPHYKIQIIKLIINYKKNYYRVVDIIKNRTNNKKKRKNMVKRHRNKSSFSKHIKTSHKKSTINRKIAYKKVDKTLKNINQIISKQMEK